jgi:beta-glucosidase
MLGSWRAQGDSVPVITLFDALTTASKTGGFQLSYAFGCHPSANTPIEKAAIDKAVEGKDVIVAHLGELHYQSGEAASRSKLNLPGNQLELLQYLKTFGKPLVLVLTNGRPLVIPEAIKLADGVLETWYLGTEAGTAIADALLGKINPQGKLTLSWPVNEGQIPVYYNHKNTGKPFEAKEKYSTKYLDIPNEPAYAFGYGLSYTSFDYNKFAVKPLAKYPKNSQLSFQVEIKNTGKTAGTETAFLFFRDMDAEIVRPVSELCGFQQIKLQAGETKLVSFKVDLSQLGYWDNDNHYLPLVGNVKFMVGPSSTKLTEVELNIE